MAAKANMGATIQADGIEFRIRSRTASMLWLCLFDDDGNETRHAMSAQEDGVFELFVPGAGEGQRYGFRAEGSYEPEHGSWFDPSKLLMDPYAAEIDRAYSYDPALGTFGADTAELMPKAVARRPEKLKQPPAPLFQPGGLIYELPVKAFSHLHPDVPAHKRGTIAALAEPCLIDHLKKLRVGAVELMPVTAWIDERHLQPLGLTNGWGYNPVNFMALDPRIAPGGIGELRETTEALRGAGIGVILDIVFNHTGESDGMGPTLCFRGLDNRTWYRHAKHHGKLGLVNDTGCGNTIACDNGDVDAYLVDCLRHFVLTAGVDGFRFDLAPILGRTEEGFDANAPFFKAIKDDPVLADRVMIAEPWDIGPGGYRLGDFPSAFLEWNDRSRDDIRRFWRGDACPGELAMRIAGSADIFAGYGVGATRTVNFLAAHDGFTLADTVSYARKHNAANGEHNRDGHNENFSWNNGKEGESDDEHVIAARNADLRAMLATLFASRGTIMLTAGDEFGRTQRGNNNAYAQDNETTWLDWRDRDVAIEAFVFELAEARAENAVLRATDFLTGEGIPPDVDWRKPDGEAMEVADWEDVALTAFAMVLAGDNGQGIHVLINRGQEAVVFQLAGGDTRIVAPRSVEIVSSV